MRCTRCGVDLSTPEKLFGKREVLQMHRQAHFSEWVSETWDLLSLIVSFDLDKEPYPNSILNHLQALAKTQMERFEDFGSVDLFTEV